MRILILSPYAPYPPYGGGTMRIYQLIRGLALHHEVTCLTFAESAEAEHGLAPLRQCCRVITVRGPEPRSARQRALTTLSSPLPDMALRNASAAYAEALRHLLQAEPFDLVQAESIEMAQYLALVPSADLTDCRTSSAVFTQPATRVLDQFNAEFVLQQRAAVTALQGSVPRAGQPYHPRAALMSLAGAGYSLVQWQKLYRYERQVMQQADLVLTVSHDDQQTLQPLAPTSQFGVVPNGVDTTLFRRAALDRPLSFGPATLVFTGTLDFRPNVDAVLWCVHEALPLIRQRYPEARLLLVGRRPAPALRQLGPADGVVLIGEVPDARPYIVGAAVYLVPMRIGGGVRLKLLEALSLEAPVVSTRMGAEGVDGLQDGVHCLLADQPSQFAAAVIRLLADPALAQQLGQAGRTLVQQGYDWLSIIPRLERHYQEVRP